MFSMGDELDIEAMLEAPYKDSMPALEQLQAAAQQMQQSNAGSNAKETNGKKVKPKHSPVHDKRHTSSRKTKDGNSCSRRSRSRERDRGRRSRSGSRSRDRNQRRSRDRRSSRHDGSGRSRSRRRSRGSHGGRSHVRKHRPSSEDNPSPPRRPPSPELTPEERDARTIFVWQLSARIRPRDLEEFFSSVGEVRDVRLILDSKTRKSKGIAYLEFRDIASVQLALALTGQKLLGVPIQIQASQAEKNRAAQPTTIISNQLATSRGNMKLYLGNLHPIITEDMLRGVFSPFGELEELETIRNSTSMQSTGDGYVVFRRAEDARRAMEKLSGLVLVGQPMQISLNPNVKVDYSNTLSMDTDFVDNGLNKLMDSSGRNALMMKLSNVGLSEGFGNNLSTHLIGSDVANAGSIDSSDVGASNLMSQSTTRPAETGHPTVETQCFMLSNMFSKEQLQGEPNLESEICEDVVEECRELGGIVHIYIDTENDEGNVYAKCVSSAVAANCVRQLHGRYFGERFITAAYIPDENYHELFPESVGAQPL